MQGFSKIKEELTKSTVLAPYNPPAPTKIAADASSYGLEAALPQKEPVSYASRSMSVRGTIWLVTTRAREKFATFVLGMHFTFETETCPSAW